MSFLVRKIDYNKWRQRKILEGEPASADAITRCMRTTENKLSLWSINGEAGLEDAVLALAAQFDHLDAIDVLCIDLSLIQDSGLHLKESPGSTPYAEFEQNHMDIVDLDYDLLGVMAQVVIESIRRDQSKRFTKSQLIEIIRSGVRDGKVHLSQLKCSIQKRISNPTPTEDAVWPRPS